MSAPTHVPGAERILGAVLFTDIEASVALQTKLGTDRYAAVLRRHGELFQAALAPVKTAHIEKHTGDGFMARFATPSEAVIAALRFQWLLARESWEVRQPPRVRCAVHQGEMLVLPASGPLPETVGTAVNLAARLLNLALGGQILLTRAVFDDARQFVREVPDLPTREQPLLGWEAHGAYLFKGIDEPVEVFEVGERGRAPFRTPVNPAHAERSVSAEEEATLGWRPARGMEVPGRRGWFLDERLGEGGFGEVWRAQNQRTREVRVFKFCFDAVRLRSLKRELLIFRLISEALGQRRDIVALHEAQLETAPFFLEGEYCAGGTLRDWFAKKQNTGGLPLEARVALVAKIARTLAAAHSVGVIHKDIKPANIFIDEARDGTVQPRLADFGIGVLTDTALVAQFGLTMTGAFTLTAEASRTGTRMYGAPEYMLGKPASVLGDIYSLGVLLYQFVAGDFDLPLGAGWQREVPDPLLAEDIAACVDVQPERRLGSALQVAERLESLAARRAAREAAARAEETARAQQALLERQRRRLRLALISGTVGVVLLAALGVAALAFYRSAQDAKKHANELEVEREATNDHLYVLEMQSVNEDLQARRAEAARKIIDRHRHPQGGRDRRGWEWYYADAILNGSTLTEAVSPQPLRALAVSPDERTVAVAGDHGEISLHHTATLARARAWPAGAPVLALGWHRAGLLAAGLASGEIVVWAAGDGREQQRWKAHQGAVTALAWHPAQSALLSGGGDGRLAWRRADGQPIREWQKQGGITAIAWRDDGRDVAVSLSQPARVLAGPVEELGSAHEFALGLRESPVAWRPGTYEVATAANNRPLRLWDPATTREELWAADHFSVGSSAFGWSALGERLALGGVDGKILIYDVIRDDTIRPPLYGHTQRVTAVHWLERERTRLLSIAEDGTLRAWDRLFDAAELTRLTFPAPVIDAQWHPRENKIAVLLADDEVRVIATDSGVTEWHQPLPGPSSVGAKFSGGHLAWSPDGTWLAAAAPSRAPIFWRLADGTARVATESTGTRTVHWLDDSRRVLLHTAKGWSWLAPETGAGALLPAIPAETRVLPLRGERFIGLRTANGELRLTPGTLGGSLGEEAVLVSGFGALACALPSHDGTRIALASESGNLAWFDVGTQRLTRPALAHVGPVQAIAWHPAGNRLVSTGADGTCRIFDSTLAAQVRTVVPGLQVPLPATGWNAQGRILMIASTGGRAIHLFDASSAWRRATGEPPPPPPARLAANCAALERRPHEDFAWDEFADEVRTHRGSGANPGADLLLAAAEMAARSCFGPLDPTQPPPGEIAKTWQGVPLPTAIQVAQAAVLQRWEEMLALATGDSAWLYQARAEALARLGRTREAEAAHLAAWRAMRREQRLPDSLQPAIFAGADRHHADLSAAAMIALHEDWTGGDQNNLRSLPTALPFPGGQFRFGNFVQLAGKSFRLSRERPLPRSTPWLPLGQPARRLNCAIAACYIDVEEPLQDRCIGALYFLRADGSGAARVPLIYGRNVWDWWVPSGGQVTEAPPERIIWRGENVNAAKSQRTLALYALPWAAAPGESPVTAVALVSHLQRPAPMLFDVCIVDE